MYHSVPFFSVLFPWHDVGDTSFKCVRHRTEEGHIETNFEIDRASVQEVWACAHGRFHFVFEEEGAGEISQSPLEVLLCIRWCSQ